MKEQFKIFLITYCILIAIASISMLGCGAVGSRNENPKKQKVSSFTVQHTGGGDPEISGAGDPPSPNPSGTPTGSTPPLNLPIRKTGYDSPFSVQVRAKRILRIKFTPGIPDETIVGTGFTPQYSQLAVYISVGNQEQSTPLLNNGLANASTSLPAEAESSPIMDFSSVIPQECPSNEQDCRVDVTITVRKPNYDYWCFNYGLYCTHTRVWETHPWNGRLDVQTDDTLPLN